MVDKPARVARRKMPELFSTGQAARVLDTTEPRLAELVRRGKILPEPEVIAGRRLWLRDHILKAAEHLGVSTEALNSRLEKEVA